MFPVFLVSAPNFITEIVQGHSYKETSKLHKANEHTTIQLKDELIIDGNEV